MKSSLGMDGGWILNLSQQNSQDQDQDECTQGMKVRTEGGNELPHSLSLSSEE